MMKPSQIKALVEANGGAVNVLQLAEASGLPLDEACQLLGRCINRGLLLPVETALFALPTDAGMPAPFRSVKTNVSAEWYKPHVKAIKKLIKSTGVGVTVRDAEDVLGVKNQTARKVLELMETQGTFVSRQSESGGAFGKRPVIWGPDERHIRKREKLYAKNKKAKKAEKTVQMGGHDVDATGWHYDAGGRLVKDA
jgi:hypothetical protein